MATKTNPISGLIMLVLGVILFFNGIGPLFQWIGYIASLSAIWGVESAVESAGVNVLLPAILVIAGLAFFFSGLKRLRVSAAAARKRVQEELRQREGQIGQVAQTVREAPQQVRQQVQGAYQSAQQGVQQRAQQLSPQMQRQAEMAREWAQRGGASSITNRQLSRADELRASIAQRAGQQMGGQASGVWQGLSTTDPQRPQPVQQQAPRQPAPQQPVQQQRPTQQQVPVQTAGPSTPAQRAAADNMARMAREKAVLLASAADDVASTVHRGSSLLGGGHRGSILTQSSLRRSSLVRSSLNGSSLRSAR